MTRSRGGSEPGEVTLSPVVACTLGGEDLRARAERWRRLRDRAGLECRKTHDGLRLSFRDDRSVEEELRALVAAERDCCAWARWELRHDGDELVLHVSSTGVGVAALQAMFGGATA